MDGFRVTLHTEVQWRIECDKGGEIHVSSASIGCQRCPHRRPAGERLFGFARHFGLSSNNNDDDDDRDDDSKPVSETCPDTYELLVRWMGADAAKGVRQGDLRRPLHVECAARCGLQPVGFADGLGAWTLCHRCVNVFHRRCFERCRRCPVCSEPTPAASFGSAGLQPDMADDDTPAPPAKRQRLEPEAAAPPPDDDATQPMDAAIDLADVAALFGRETWAALPRRVQAYVNACRAAAATDNVDGILRPTVTSLPLPPGTDAFATAEHVLCSRELAALTPAGWRLKWFVRAGATLALELVSCSSGEQHASACAATVAQASNWMTNAPGPVNDLINVNGDGSTRNNEGVRAPDTKLWPVLADADGRQNPRVIIEVEDKHRGPTEARRDFARYFAETPQLRVVVAVIYYQDTWRASCVAWRRDGDGPPTLWKAIDFGRGDLAPQTTSAWCNPGNDLLPGVPDGGWTRVEPHNPAWPETSSDGQFTERPTVRIAAADILWRVNTARTGPPVYLDVEQLGCGPLTLQLDTIVRQAAKSMPPPNE